MVKRSIYHLRYYIWLHAHPSRHARNHKILQHFHTLLKAPCQLTVWFSGHAARPNSRFYLHGQYFNGINFRIGRGISIKISLWLCGPMSSERVSWRLSAIFRIIFVPWRYEKPHAISSTKMYHEKKHDEKQKTINDHRWNLPFAVVASIIQICGSIDFVPFWHCLSASSIKSSDSLVTLSKLTKTKNSLSSFNKTVIFHSNERKWPVFKATESNRH